MPRQPTNAITLILSWIVQSGTTIEHDIGKPIGFRDRFAICRSLDRFKLV